MFKDTSKDPAEIEAWTNPVNYKKNIDTTKPLSLDANSHLENNIAEIIYPQDQAQEQEVLYLKRLNFLRSGMRSGMIAALLSRGQYEVFRLYFTYNQTVAQISKKLKIARQTVETQLQRAFTKLRNHHHKV